MATDKEMADLDVDVEPLFKAVPPYKVSDSGYGYTGILLHNKKDGTLQCHVCGKWFKMLGTHACTAHKLPTERYRKKFSLPLKYPLCSREVSASRAKNSLRPEHIALLKGLGKRYRLKGKKLSKKVREVMTYAKTCEAFKNKNGACDAQMLSRYLVVCDIVGHQASQRDLTAHDNSLRGLIYRRFGNINAFREKHGLETVARAPIHSDAAIIAQLHGFFKKHGRVPRPTDFREFATGKGLVSTNTIRLRFGSFHRGLLMAGFSVEDADLAAFKAHA